MTAQDGHFPALVSNTRCSIEKCGISNFVKALKSDKKLSQIKEHLNFKIFYNIFLQSLERSQGRLQSCNHRGTSRAESSCGDRGPGLGWVSDPGRSHGCFCCQSFETFIFVTNALDI